MPGNNSSELLLSKFKSYYLLQNKDLYTCWKRTNTMPYNKLNQDDYSNQEIMPPGPPHDALFLVLTYLHVSELLAMSEVCKSLRDAVNLDVLPWLEIMVERPLSFKLSNENLIRITAKADGRLRALALVNCANITDDGLLQVIKKNPQLNKVQVPGCSALTPEGIIHAVEMLNGEKLSLKSLSINGIINLKKQHLETLWKYLSFDLGNQEDRNEKPFLYHEYRNMSSLEQSKIHLIIDVDICHRCDEVGMVFDCPREICKEKSNKMNICRGCIRCISRCSECGVCIEFGEMEEAICPDILCSECWLQLPKCNLCNRPYCRQHSICSTGSGGFICGICEEKYVKNSMSQCCLDRII